MRGTHEHRTPSNPDTCGKLDDSSGSDTPRERFRRFLQENVTRVGEVRDYIEECLRTSGDQYSRALQDLVNHLGHFLGFPGDFWTLSWRARTDRI